MVPSLPGPGVPSKRVAGIAVAELLGAIRRARREARLPGLAALVVGDREADLLRIVVATTAHAERFGAFGCGAQHPVERGHRSIVQVRRGGPDAVERARAIPGPRLILFGRLRTGIRAVLALAPPGLLNLRVDLGIVHRLAADDVDEHHQAHRVRHVGRRNIRQIAAPPGIEFLRGIELEEARHLNRPRRQHTGLSGVGPHAFGALLHLVEEFLVADGLPARRGPDALAWKFGVERGIVDRSEMAFGADLRIELAAAFDAFVVDLPCSITKNVRRPFR